MLCPMIAWTSILTMAAEFDQVRYWHDSMASVPLLAKDEMIRLGMLIQDPSTPEHRRKKAIDKLVLHNMRLIPSIVRRTIASKRTVRYGDTFTEDLLQVAVLGLYRAAAKFDPSRGYAFSTYATMWIYQAVSREVTCNYGMIRVPENTVRDFYNAVKKERNLMFPEQEPKVRERLVNAYFALNCASIDALASDVDEGIDFHSVIGETDKNMQVEDPFDELIAMGSFDEKQEAVMRLIYEKSMTQAEVAKTVGISRNAVKRIHDVGLRRLRLVMSR